MHIGVGGFHRAHQAYYIHQLLENHGITDWAICGVGLRENDRNMMATLEEQDGLYTLVIQHPDGTSKSQVIGSIKEYLLAVDHPQEVIDKMSHSDTKIVSMTITEGGYNFNPVTGEFDFENPDIQHELAHPTEPKTMYGYVTAALRKRRDNGLPAFSILSCDNIQHNGDIVRKMVLTFAERQDSKLAEWIEEHVCFPNSMVDRITPVTSSKIIEYVKNKYDIEEKWPVVCEPFIQWVIEDSFSNGRPPLELVGVQIVPDVTPYEKIKIRLLNAGHSVLGITGAIHGHPTIDICMNDPVFASFMRNFMDIEVTPILDTVEGINIEEYKNSLHERFSNPNIKDDVSRICSESSAKLPKFLIPTLKENLERGGSIQYATFVLAAWCYYSDKGINEKGVALEIIDENKKSVKKAARDTKNNWTSFIEQADIFGDLTENDRFTSTYLSIIKIIYRENNIRSVMKKFTIT